MFCCRRGTQIKKGHCDMLIFWFHYKIILVFVFLLFCGRRIFMNAVSLHCYCEHSHIWFSLFKYVTNALTMGFYSLANAQANVYAIQIGNPPQSLGWPGIYLLLTGLFKTANFSHCFAMEVMWRIHFWTLEVR